MANFQLAASQLNYLDVSTLSAWQQAGRAHAIVDTRSAAEYANGTVPHAVHLPATHARSTMSSSSHAEHDANLQRLKNRAADEDLVFVAQACTEGPGDAPDRQQSAHVVYTLDVLFFHGVPAEKMWQLSGGLDAWIAAGGVLQVPEAAAVVANDIGAVLDAAGLAHLAPLLAAETLESVQAAALASRSAFLARLKQLGVASLSDRQKVATLCAKAARAAGMAAAHGQAAGA